MSNPASFSQGIGLRGRIVALVAGLVSTVVLITSAFNLVAFTRTLDDAITSKSVAMQEALKRKGEAIVRNVALTSSRAIAVGNFSFLVEAINTTVSGDGEVVYGILMDTKRLALVHSVASLSNAQLDEAVDRFAADQTQVANQSSTFEGAPVLEVIAPIDVAEQRWGVVRFGMTLKHLRAEIAQSEATARAQMLRAIYLSLAANAILLLVGILAARTFAISLTRPLESLLGAAHRIREGDLSQQISVQGSPEFKTLGNAFNDMSTAVQQRQIALQDALSDAERAIRLKGEFLANVSHELRTPLNAIINMPAALCRDYQTRLVWMCGGCNARFEPDPESTSDATAKPEACPKCSTLMALKNQTTFHGDPNHHYYFLQRTLQSSKMLLAVVSDILDFSKLEAGKMPVNQADISVEEVLREVGETVSALTEPRKQTLVWPKLAPNTLVWADHIKLSQVLLNLLSNAAKFTPEGGTLEVRFTPESPTSPPLFEVHDTGMGIPPDKLEIIFESFRQVDGGHTRAQGGTGLGLSISRKLVELQGGRIWAESGGENKPRGSRFFFTLGRPTHKVVVAPVPEQTMTGKILVVDDDVNQLEILEDLLHTAGHQVQSLSSPEQALPYMMSTPVDVVVLDLMMPNMSGLTVLKAIKREQATAKTPVVVSSAYHSNRALVESLGGLWLPKPIDSVELARIVEEACRLAPGRHSEKQS